MSELLAAVNGTVMYTTTAVLPMSTGVTDVSLEVTTEDLNISTTESPAPPWLQVTAACGGLASLNATGGDGPCIPGVSPGDNGSTSTAVAAAGPQCPVFVQPWALLLLAFPVMTVFGNVLVCLSVYRERSLRTATNFFIVSLAIADVMVAILVMPLAVYVEVRIANFHSHQLRQVKLSSL